MKSAINLTKSFSIEHLSTLLGETKQDVRRCQEYILQYFFHTFNGVFYYSPTLNPDDPEDKNLRYLGDPKTLSHSYLPNGLEMSYLEGRRVVKFNCRKWFIGSVFERYKVVFKLAEPTIDREAKQINLLAQLKHAHHERSAFDDVVADKGRVAVQKMCDHILTVWCSGNQKQYEYVMDWLSCTGRRKVKSALYLQSLEQSGKGVVYDFLSDYVFGRAAVYTTANTETLSQYTQPMEGRVLVNINELPCASKGEFQKIINKIKTLITDPTFDCRRMHEQNRPAKNTFNFIFFSNNDAVALTTTNYKRYKCLDVSNDRIGDRNYFDGLVKACMNDAAGLAFYLHLRDRYNATGKNFNVDSFPTSESFKDKICERLESPLNFLKFKFIKKGRGLDKVPQATLYKQYVDWFEPETKGAFVTSPYTNVKFAQCLKTLRSVEKKTVRIDTKRLVVYSGTLKDLQAEFDGRGWIHELDEIDNSSEDSNIDITDENDVAKLLGGALDSGVKPFATCGDNIVTFD